MQSDFGLDCYQSQNLNISRYIEEGISYVYFTTSSVARACTEICYIPQECFWDFIWYLKVFMSFIRIFRIFCMYILELMIFYMFSWINVWQCVRNFCSFHTIKKKNYVYVYVFHVCMIFLDNLYDIYLIFFRKNVDFFCISMKSLSFYLLFVSFYIISCGYISFDAWY